MLDPSDVTWFPRAAIGTARVFTRAQAMAAGASRGQVARRVAAGHWVPVAGAGLRHAQHPLDARMLVAAARLTWPGGIVIGPVAAAFHGAPVALPSIVDVAGRVPATRTSRGLRPRFVDVDGDVLSTHAWQVVDEERAFLGTLMALPLREAEQLLAWLTAYRRLTVAQIAEDVARRPGRHGNRRLRALVAWAARGAMSEGERRLHAILDRAGISGWEAGVVVHDARGVVGTVDVLLSEARLVIEVDGYEAHRGRFHGDRERRNRLVAAGYTVLNYTWEHLTEHPGRVAQQVRTMVERLTL